MKAIVSFIIISFVCCFTLTGQSPKFKEKYLKAITEESLKQHVYTLASDSLKGRNTGSEGEHKAASYIIENFEAHGLKPFNDTTYLQNIGLWSWHWGTMAFSHEGKNLEHYKDIVNLSSSPIEPSLTTKAVYLADGNDSILNAIDLEGKIAVVLLENLKRWYSLSSKTKRKGAVALFVVHPTDEQAFTKLATSMETVHKQQSIYKNRPSFSAHLSKAFAIEQSTLAQLFDTSFDKLVKTSDLKKIKKLNQPKITISCPIIIEKAEANNVAGYLPGKDNTTDAIVITAHYDHIGERYNGICVGADDNASGTAAVMELAKAFAPLKGKLDKNLIFLTTSGEEKGLLGAFYFADHPNEHRFNIKANVNIDMIGRIDSTHKSNYIYTIGNNHYPEFDSLLHVANNEIEPLHIQYDYNESQGFDNFLRLSDHYAFHRLNIPVMGFFSGLHKDYHKPSDTPDKIDYNEMTQRVKLIFTTTFLAAQKTAFSQQDD